MGFLKFILCFAIVLLVVRLAFWGIRVLGNAGASEAVIATWSLTTTFVVTLFLFVELKNDIYYYFYDRPEAYESPAVAGSNGLAFCSVFLICSAVLLAYILWDEGLARRSAAICRRRREARFNG